MSSTETIEVAGFAAAAESCWIANGVAADGSLAIGWVARIGWSC